MECLCQAVQPFLPMPSFGQKIQEFDPIRIYIGSTEKQIVPLRVLESSILRRTSYPIEFHPIYEQVSDLPIPLDPANRPKTDYSFHRFLVPSLAGYTGRAVYLDADMIVFQDIHELWKAPLKDYEVLTCFRHAGPPQFSVMLLDCQKLKWRLEDFVNRLDSGDLTYRKLMDFQFGANVSVSLPADWNSLDRYQEGKTCLLHYSKTTKQPWLFDNHPLEGLWIEELRFALMSGILNEETLHNHIQKGWIKSSIQHELLK